MINKYAIEYEYDYIEDYCIIEAKSAQEAVDHIMERANRGDIYVKIHNVYLCVNQKGNWEEDWTRVWDNDK